MRPLVLPANSLGIEVDAEPSTPQSPQIGLADSTGVNTHAISSQQGAGEDQNEMRRGRPLSRSSSRSFPLIPRTESHPTIVVQPPPRILQSDYDHSRSRSRSRSSASSRRCGGSRSRSRSPFNTRVRIRSPSPPVVVRTRRSRSRSSSSSFGDRRLSRSPTRSPWVYTRRRSYRSRSPSPFIPPVPLILSPPQVRPWERPHPATPPPPVSLPYHQPPVIVQPPWPPGRVPVELLTYTLNGKLAYVPAGRTYTEALDYAVDAFPALGAIDRARISLHVSGHDSLVRVPACAWADVLLDLPKYGIVTVEVEDDAPPEYDPAKAAKAGAISGAGAGAPAHNSGLFGFLKRVFGGK